MVQQSVHETDLDRYYYTKGTKAEAINSEITFQQYSVPPLHRTTIAVLSQALTVNGLVSTDFHCVRNSAFY